MEKNKVEQVIRALRNIDVTNENVSKNAKELLLSVGKLHVAMGTMYANTKVCRTRTHFNHVLFTDVREITTPASQYVVKFGRCNKQFSPMFYCSEDRITSYSELVQDWLKDCPDGASIYATISTWYSKRDLNLVVIASPDVEKRVTEFDKFYGSRLDDAIANLAVNERDGAVEYHRFLYEMFSKPGKENVLTYIITSAYSELALEYAGEKADGIVYPCVPRKGEGLNYALKPEFIKSANIELRTVFRDKIKRVNQLNALPDLKEVELIEACPDFTDDVISWFCNETKKFEL